jgi:hypothetical protein
MIAKELVKKEITGLHRNGKTTNENILVEAFDMDVVPGVEKYIVSHQDDELAGITNPEVIANHRVIFNMCQQAGAIPKTINFEDGFLQFNWVLHEIRFVSKSYCPMAAESELAQLLSGEGPMRDLL